MNNKKLKEQVETTRLALEALQHHIIKLEEEINQPDKPSIFISPILEKAKKVKEVENTLAHHRSIYQGMVKKLHHSYHDELNRHMKKLTEKQ